LGFWRIRGEQNWAFEEVELVGSVGLGSRKPAVAFLSLRVPRETPGGSIEISEKSQTGDRDVPKKEKTRLCRRALVWNLLRTDD
jgi:hypothetical protein